MRNGEMFLLAHVIPLVIVVAQENNLSDSYHGITDPLYFWVTAVLVSGALCAGASYFTRDRATGAPTIPIFRYGILPKCYHCSQLCFPRTFHCSKCGICVVGQVGHLEFSDSCISRIDLGFIIPGVLLEIVYFAVVSFEMFTAICNSSSAIRVIINGVLFLATLPASAFFIIQMMIFFPQFCHLALKNGVILESRKLFGVFEYFIVQKSSRNPYNAGFSDNVNETVYDTSPYGWPPLTPGPETDAYCEDMLKYRNTDLRPTVIIEQKVYST